MRSNNRLVAPGNPRHNTDVHQKMMKRKSQLFWLIVVPLIAIAIQVALLCLAAFTSMSYPKGAGAPAWADSLLCFFAWPLQLYDGWRSQTVWIGFVLSFLWMPAIAFGIVKVYMLLKGKDTEQNLGDAESSAPQD